MREKFHEQLELLNTELIEMGALCENAINNATNALMHGDTNLARKVNAFDSDIDEKERKIEAMCFRLLLQQQPVAGDLRQISSALKMITDLERIGDQASDIAEIVMLENVQPREDVSHIGKMAKATIKMVTDAIDAFVRRDLQLAQSVIAYDDVVDDLFNQVKRELIDLIRHDPDRSEYAVDILLIAKYFERIGDHATNTAEWVEFAVTGKKRKDEE